MPIKMDGELFFSIKELSTLSTVGKKKINAVLAEGDYTVVVSGSDRYIPKKQLGGLFNAIQKNAPKHYYTLNSQFTDAAWRKALAAIYKEQIAFPACLAPAQGEFLRSLILNLGPSTVVEIGCFIGASTIWAASALEDLGDNRTLYGIDLFEDKYPCPPFTYTYFSDSLQFAQDMTSKAELAHRIKFIQGHSLDVGARFNELIGAPIDFLFIDGDHTVDGCIADFFTYEPKLKAGGYILLHDIYPKICGWDGPRVLIDRILRNDSRFEVMEITTAPLNFGLALIRKTA
ncbi:MAG: class I SAM-dependent methyltransferase [Pseudomonadota bacterium]